MNKCQKLTPKYWVVHDVKSDDIFTFTMDKNQRDSIIKFLLQKGKELYGISGDISCEDYYNSFLCDERYACNLVEVKLV